MNRIKLGTSIAAILMTFVFINRAEALIVSGTGATDIISTPAVATLNTITSSTQARAWNELQRISLSTPVVVDALGVAGIYNSSASLGTYSLGGILVDSHFIHFDSPGATGASVTGTVTFATQIVGVIVRGDTTAFSRLDDSDWLGAGTLYDDNLGARGMEISANERFVISPDLKSIQYVFNISEPGDRIRVLTQAVPEPTTMVALGAALAGVVARRKRK